MTNYYKNRIYDSFKLHNFTFLGIFGTSINLQQAYLQGIVTECMLLLENIWLDLLLLFWKFFHNWQPKYVAQFLSIQKGIREKWDQIGFKPALKGLTLSSFYYIYFLVLNSSILLHVISHIIKHFISSLTSYRDKFIKTHSPEHPPYSSSHY